MKSLKNWQISFLIGLAILILIIYIDKENNLSVRIIGGVTLVILIFNGLLTTGSDDRRIVLRFLKAILNITPFLKILVIFIWAFNLSIITNLAVNQYNKKFIADIKGSLLTNNGLIANGTIQLIIKSDTLTVETNNGEFIFDSINLKNIDSLQFMVRKENCILTKTIKSEFKNNQILKFNEPCEPLPLTTIYYNVDISLIDTLLFSKTPNFMPEILGKQTHIVQNEIFKEAETLVKLYSANTDDLNGWYEYDMKFPSYYEHPEKWSLNFGFIDSGEIKSIDYPSISFVRDMNTTEHQHRIFKRLLGGNYPKKFGKETFLNYHWGCARFEFGDFSIYTSYPDIQLTILLFKNNTEETIIIGDITGYSTYSDTLRTIEFDSTNINNEELLTYKNWMPNAYNLEPDKTILIPLYISVVECNSEPDIRWQSYSQTFQSLNKTERQEFLNSELSFHFNSSSNSARPSQTQNFQNDFNSIINFIKHNPCFIENDLSEIPSNRRFLYKKRYIPSSIVVNNTKYSIREFDYISTLQLPHENFPFLEAGSCPYVFSYNGEWIEEGKIFIDYNSKPKFKYDTLQLRNFKNKILIKEVDPEQSFIDYLEIYEINNKGNTIKHPLNNKLINKPDSVFLILNQGDSIELNINSKYNSESLYLLVGKGYYIENKHNK